MRNEHEDRSDLKIRLVLAVLTIFAATVLSGRYKNNLVRGAASGPAPRVTAVTQVTHDGYRKENLLADGAQLFVTELPESNRVIAKVQLPKSNRTVLPTPFNSLQALDLSPDHSKLLISSRSTSGENEFWTLPVAKGRPQRLGDLSGRDAAWSPDGKLLVFAKGSRLYLASAAGTEARELYSAGGSVFAPRFSPDATQIRFSVSNTEQNTTALWEVARDGSNPHALLGGWPNKTTACCGNWTADGQYYIFQASQAVPNTSLIVTSLWALSADEDSAPAQITAGPMSFGNPSPSPDNKKIWAIGVQPTAEVVKYEAAKKKYVPLIPGLSATDVDFSADGKWISYVAIPEGALWRSRVDGSDRLQLTSGDERTALPRWSPDGKQIAFVSLKPGESWKLYLVSADGGTPRPIVKENGSQIDANWSADGQQLMFGDYSHSSGSINIRLLDLKSGNLTTIPGSQGLFSPRWSPDGRHIAAISPDNTTLMLFSFETKTWSTWIKESAGAVSYPVWSADSKYLYFDDLVNGTEAIRRMKVGGSAPEGVYELETFERYLGALGPWSGRAADGSWMFVRDRSTQEVYQLSMELP
jgi:Tol biopolymer transport system component